MLQKLHKTLVITPSYIKTRHFSIRLTCLQPCQIPTAAAFQMQSRNSSHRLQQSQLGVIHYTEDSGRLPEGASCATHAAATEADLPLPEPRATPLPPDMPRNTHMNTSLDTYQTVANTYCQKRRRTTCLEAQHFSQPTALPAAIALYTHTHAFQQTDAHSFEQRKNIPPIYCMSLCITQLGTVHVACLRTGA